MSPAPDPDDDLLPAFTGLVKGFTLLLLLIGALPWALSGPGEARHALSAMQMVEQGNWLVQYAPDGTPSTQPPLHGWLSATSYLLCGKNFWDAAWRLPSVVAIAMILVMIWRTGENLLGSNIGAVLAFSAVAFNAITPALTVSASHAALTAGFSFMAGYLILVHLQGQVPWSRRARIAFALALTGGVMTTGLGFYGLILPGVLITRFFAKENVQFCPEGGPKWWLEWTVPLLAYASWLWFCLEVPGFSRSFIAEFVATWRNFTAADLPGYYTLNLLALSFPWSGLLLAFLGIPKVRQSIKVEPTLLWISSWLVGGLIYLECTPAKQQENLLSLLPPLALLIAGSARFLPRFKAYGEPIGRIAVFTPLCAILFSFLFTGFEIRDRCRDGRRELGGFARRVNVAVGPGRQRLAVAESASETVLAYVGELSFTSLSEIKSRWQARQIDWLIVESQKLRSLADALPAREIVASMPNSYPKTPGYTLIHRTDADLPRSGEPVRIQPAPQSLPDQPSTPIVKPPPIRYKPGETPAELR